jgi:ribosomal protein L11 methyltransferase
MKERMAIAEAGDHEIKGSMPRTIAAGNRTPKTPTHYVWRKLSAAKWEDVWVDRLSEVADRLAITALAGSKTIRLEAFQLTRTQAERLRKAFGGSVAVQTKQRAVSEAVRAPIRVREKLVIVGSERERAALAKTLPGRALLVIPAGMAFGTGDHATTATCLRFIADLSAEFDGRPWDMLDLGAGSGILALAARMLGARHVEAGDFDPHAVRTAKENVRLNRLAGVVVKKTDVRDWNPTRTWDVVAANLFSDLLQAVSPKIVSVTAPGGWVVFSGILRAQEGEVVSAFRRAGLRIERLVRKGKWVSGLARKKH